MSNNIPTAEFELYGELAVPESLEQLSSILREASRFHFGPFGGGVGAWRGQANIAWKVESGAVRRVRNTGLGQMMPQADYEDRAYYDSLPDTLEQKVARYEEALLNEARLRGYGYYNNRPLSDLEFLGTLQHYGAATRFLDFTRNAYIALWFASNECLDKYGLLLGLSRNGPGFENTFVQENISILIANLSGQIHIWEPLKLYERMRVQQSVLVFGQAFDGPWGCLSPMNFDAHRSAVEMYVRPDFGLYSACAVSPKLKDILRKIWQPMFGYSNATLFPDIEGYSRYHSAQSVFESEFWDIPWRLP